ncbi:SusC/RagA family TonB-linked outer membrane protein [Mangrovivirga cuniculi]|uniref:SusC/RagA family TonB-linked outer membrane protein n=1 Tax=Mangrovivirga cuniculi TaxID=2715131 RepID=A0A4D7JV04_9BACT|nr:TonB-dependent receptor [Mangrovivirga cuniculi]QCK16412.1 SusC/RagA family TonB-linked outer membrane protein [Mangrovivirga cuniculi]
MKNYLLRFAQSKTCLLTLLFSMCILSVFGQNKNVSGQILSDEDGYPLPGVTVLIKDSKKGTVTDANGNFTISAAPDDVLVCTFIGFEKTEVPIANRTTVNIRMTPDITQMEEIVVVGYGTQKKSHLTGAISKVENENLDQMPVSRVDEALVGQVSGVNIRSTEGEAGSSPTIRIRGTGSITGSSAPAIVVDGLVVDNDFLANLDMNTVESFEVLKDAASSAIYGSRGANGVILITTKQGKAGKTKFSYNGYYGVKEAYQSDAYYFSVAETAKAELAANGELSSRTLYKQLIGIDRDWQDVIFDGGTIQNHSISARGGNDRTKFSVSLSYLHDEGVLLTDDFKRYNLRLKIDTDINDKLSFGASITPSYSDRRRFDGSTHDILRQTPWLPVYHDENTIQFVDRNTYPDVQIGDYALQRHFDNYDLYGDGSELVDISNTSNTNPAAKVLERDRNDYKFKTFGNIYLQYEIIDGLKFKTVFSGDYQITKRDRWQGVLSNRNGAAAAQYDVSNLDRIHLVTENYFTYEKTIGAHDINAVAGFSAESYDTRIESITGTGYDSDLIKTISAATQIAGAESSSFENNFMSFYGRVNYSYLDKFLASISIRRDGSSVFGPENKFGNFPAFSVGWRLSEEPFMATSKVVDELKLRASYGFTGNNRLNTGNDLVDNYPYLPLLEANTAVVNNSIVGAFNALNIANPELQWERSREFNPAIDYVLFDGTLSGSIDYYVRTSDQLLLFNPISSTTGFNNALVNLGEVKNSGVEVEFRTRNINKEDFKWSTTLLFSKNENELVDFAESNGQIQNVDSKRAAEWINLEGHPISSFYGWVVDRDIPLEYINNPYHPVGGEAQDVYVKDLNGDGLIDDDDKTIIGNPYPDLIWSVTNSFTFKNFDLTFLFQGSHGAEIRNMGDQYLFNHFNSSQDFDPAITPDQGFIKQKIFTNDIVQDASYVALRNLNIGYNFSSSTLSKMGLTSLRIYAAGQNLLYFTANDYTGFNPESIYTTSSTTYGYQRAGSPIFRTISLGLNLEF